MKRIEVTCNKLLNFLAWAIVFWWLVFPVTSGAEPYQQDSSGLVSMETENFDVHVSNGAYEWTFDYTSGYSGTSAMKAPARSYLTDYMENSPRLDYEVDFQYSGVHYLWVRVYATSSGSNSLHAGLNGGSASGGANIHFDAAGSYVWAETTLTIPSAGLHTVNLWCRERRAVVDKVVLTTDGGYVPGNFGPPESPRGEGVALVSAPVINPGGGAFVDGVTVALSSATAEAVIYYTIDGSIPTAASTLYVSPFSLSADATVKAKGMLSGYNDSSVTTAVFTITDGTPPGGGTGGYLQDSSGLVSMEAENFDVHVVKGGNEWSVTYTSGYSGTSAMKAPARSYLTDYMENSPRLDYEVDFQYSGVHYLWVRVYATSSGSNSLHAGLNGGSASGGANIHFDAAGSYVWAETTLTIPSAGLHTVNLWCRERRAVVDKVVLTTDGGYVPGNFGPPESPRGEGVALVSAPVINPGGGAFVDGVTVALSSATAEAVIYYTIDGSIPTAASTLYVSPFSLSADATVKAKGMLSGYNDSSVTTAVFTITDGTPPGGGTGGYLQDSSGLVSMEAENFDVHVVKGGNEWSVTYTSGYSGTSAMKAPARSYLTDYMENSPRLDYEVDFQYSGVHYLWVRVYATSSGSNSLHAGLNGGSASGGANIHFDAAGSYVWAETTLTIPSAGLHTVNLWCRERRAVVDKVVLTTDGGYVPGNFGPPESPRGEGVGVDAYYVAVGDSITQGTGDDDPADDISLDGRNSGGGFPPILNDLLTQFFGYSHTVINEGVGGTTSADGLINLPTILGRHNFAQRFLIMYGMNDARPWAPVPSGLGLFPGDSGYPGTFKDNVQRMLNLVKNSGREALLAKTIIALGDSAAGTTYEDPHGGERSLLIQQYNEVIEELILEDTDINFYAPDFYDYFANHFGSEYADNIHPNGQGYNSMALIWFDILTLPQYTKE